MNEETIFDNRPEIKGQVESKKEGSAWKQVTLGGVSGILMGAGLMYGSQVIAKEPETEESPKVDSPEQGETSYTLENGLKVAAVSDDLSFGEAFQQARAEVGAGGVFHWHGGIYNTYTAEEWNAMTVEQKHDFAQQVQPEIQPDQLTTPTDANSHVVVVHHVHHREESSTTQETPQETASSEEVEVVAEQVAQNFNIGNDVHIVGYANAEGHLVVGYDTTGDGQADVAIIDVDNNLRPSDADVIMDSEGNMTTLGELNNEPDPNQYASMENPEVAPDMPDYMNEANIDDMNILA